MGESVSSDVSNLPESRAREFLDDFRVDARKVLARFRIPAQDAEDLLQDVLLLYLTKKPAASCVEGWLQWTLKHRCLVYWRERRRRFYSSMDSALLEALAEPTAPCQEHRVFLRDVVSRLEQLPHKCASLLKLRYQSDFKPSQLADLLGYSRTGIYKTLERCLAALSKSLLVTRRRRA
ncbi:MAG: sigma-70 family RNA polymerase sigma factor [bacterium]|nr:sigma-70 family RNA polymerase sigma factor [bacterium]